MNDRLIAQAFHKALPILAAIVATIGGATFAVFAPPGTMNRVTSVGYSLAGIVGSAGVFVVLQRLRRFPLTWQVCGLRRNLVSFLICLCWTFGAVSGFILFYIMPR